MNPDMPATPELSSTHEAPPESREPQHAWERFLLAVQGANDGFYDWNLLTDEIYLSPRWKELIGYSDAELANRFETWVELLHPEDREQATATTHRLLAGELSQYQIEYRLRHKDGSYRWVRSCGAILRDATGKPIRLGGWHIDLTELRRVSEHLQQQTRVANLYADMSLALARRTSLRAFLQHCVDALLAHVPLDWVGIWAQERGRHGFVPLARASRAFNVHGGEYDLPVGAQTVGKIAASRQRLLSQEAQHDPLLQPQEQAWAQREGMSIFVGYPLLVESGVVGVLALFAREPLPEVILDALGSLALIMAQASERLQAEEDHA
jgi:PAS domain S-box-containing protein